MSGFATRAGGPGVGGWPRWAPSLLAAIGICFAAGRAPAEGAVDLSGALSLEDVLRIALERNHGLARTAEGVSSARADQRGARAALLPTLGADVNYSHSDSRYSSTRIDLSTGRISTANKTERNDNHSLSVGGRLDLVDPSAWYRVRRAGEALEGSEQGYEDAVQSLVLEVTTQYYELVRRKELAQVADRAYELAGEQLERAEALFHLGSVAKTDVLQAQVNRASAERDRIASHNGVDQERARLAVMLALPVDAPVELAAPPQLPDSLPLPGEPVLIQQATGARPDLKQAEAALGAARLGEKSARWGRYPTLGATYSWSKQEETGRDLLSDLDLNRSFRVGLGLSVPIFDGFSTKATIEQATASRRDRERALDQAKLNVALDVHSALIGIKNAREEIRSARQGVVYAEESVRLQKALYESGGGTLLQWNNSQVELTRARVSLVQAEVNLRLAHAGLEKALGRSR